MALAALDLLARVIAASVGFTDRSSMTPAFAQALDGEVGRDVSFNDGRRSLEFVTACYHSSRTGQPVDLPIAADHPLYSGWLPDFQR